MGKIPKAQGPITDQKRINPKIALKSSEKIVFSFKAIEKNVFFNLDCTCQNWARDLFNTMKTVSDISVDEVYAGKYSGDGSPLRIHRHQNAKSPCDLPKNVNLEEMWQIRISKSKGGIHGVFNENIFYIIWFDPLHHLYPDDRYGGLKRIRPPLTCCKDSDEELEQLNRTIVKKDEYIGFLEEYVKECEKSIEK